MRKLLLRSKNTKATSASSSDLKDLNVSLYLSTISHFINGNGLIRIGVLKQISDSCSLNDFTLNHEFCG